jgi:hypothetical protein
MSLVLRRTKKHEHRAPVQGPKRDLRGSLVQRESRDLNAIIVVKARVEVDQEMMNQCKTALKNLRARNALNDQVPGATQSWIR